MIPYCFKNIVANYLFVKLHSYIFDVHISLCWGDSHKWSTQKLGLDLIVESSLIPRTEKMIENIRSLTYTKTFPKLPVDKH